MSVEPFDALTLNSSITHIFHSLMMDKQIHGKVYMCNVLENSDQTEKFSTMENVQALFALSLYILFKSLWSEVCIMSF